MLRSEEAIAAEEEKSSRRSFIRHWQW